MILVIESGDEKGVEEKARMERGAMSTGETGESDSEELSDLESFVASLD